jgi:hypothetical protein
MSVFEIVMLLCFGFAWPFSIYRSYKSRSTHGKSVVFLYVVFAGYIAGILNKVFNQPDLVVIFYIINLFLVSIDIVLFYRNRMLERKGRPS